MMTRNLAIALETVGCCVVLAGITVEVALGAHLGYILITAGAWVVSVGALIWAKLLRHGGKE